MMTDPTPMQLWEQARQDYPDNDVWRAFRYRELMIEHGYLIVKDGGDDGT